MIVKFINFFLLQKAAPQKKTSNIFLLIFETCLRETDLVSVVMVLFQRFLSLLGKKKILNVIITYYFCHIRKVLVSNSLGDGRIEVLDNGPKNG